MKKCTGINCPMQAGKVDPKTCRAVATCEYATPPITRADYIRAMTDKELAAFLAELATCDGCPAEETCRIFSMDGCKGGMLMYLQKEVIIDG